MSLVGPPTAFRPPPDRRIDLPGPPSAPTLSTLPPPPPNPKLPTLLPPPPTEITHTGAGFLPAHKMTKFCIYSKRLPPIAKKTVTTTNDRNFCVLPDSILYFFIYPPPPGKSSSWVFLPMMHLCRPIKRPNFVFIQNAPPPICSEKRFQP